MADEQTTPGSWHDPIVAEVRRDRESLFAAADYDIREFCRRLSERQGKSGHPVVRRGTKGSSGEAA